MVLDKLVNSTQLDADLTTIANAIRTKGGTSEQLSFPDGMAQAITDIEIGIIPTGNINITDTNVTDVTNYATAQVVDADLIAANIKKNVNILGVVGSFEGGSLPSVISKIDGGSFTLTSDTQGNIYNIAHNLGEKPKGFVIWSDDVVYGTAESTIMVANLLYKVCNYSATAVGSYMMTRKTTSGAFGQYTNTVAATAENSWLSTSDIKIGITSTYKAGCTYKWIAWA